jgi:hypothetical protein
MNKLTIIRFFYDLLHSKRPNWKKASEKEQIVYLIKYYTGLYFFDLGNLYHSFITRITGHYPFSLLYRDRLFHHDNLKVKKIMIKIEKIAQKAGINLMVLSGGIEENTVEMIGYLDQGKKDRQSILKSLEEKLQEQFGSIYIRDNRNNFKILMPTDLFESIIN